MPRFTLSYTEFSYKCGPNLSSTKHARRECLTLHDGRVIEGPKLRTLKHRNAGFKLKLEDWAQMYEDQDGKCAICRQPETREYKTAGVCELCIDHDHDTGKVRALLCDACNTGIGRLNDDISRVWTALEYLVKHGAKRSNQKQS